MKYKNLNLHDLKNKKILIIYPHPDDETFMSAGLIQKLSKFNIDFKVISLTKGENGNEILKNKTSDKIAKIREIEFKNVMNLLGVRNYEIKDFGDGELKNKKSEIRNWLREIIVKENFNLISTYDSTGMYGHPDHIALSYIVEELKKDLNYSVLYSVLPPVMHKYFNPTKHIRNDVKKLEIKYKNPELKLNITTENYKKYKALQLYKSQKLNHEIPLWLQSIIIQYEYYSTSY